jgi:arginine deiminase
MGVYIQSEVQELQEVILHSPGKEVETMTPSNAGEVLFNEIMPGSVVSREHATLKSFLKTICKVYEIKDLFIEALDIPAAREDLMESLRSMYGKTAYSMENLSSADLAETLITGKPIDRNSLSNFLSTEHYDIPPLPNLYFMRDGAAVYRNTILLGRMAHRVRRSEEAVLRTVFTGHPIFSESRVFQSDNGTMEGGDIFVVRKDLLVLGLSERTAPEAVDSLLAGIVSHFGEPIKVLAVVLPKKRAVIHLDMIMTFLDTQTLLLYEPYFFGRENLPVIRMDIIPGREPSVRYADSLSAALKECGLECGYVSCGGCRELEREREQWFAATNVFSFAPGKAAAFSFNTATLEALSQSGFQIKEVEHFINGTESTKDYDKLIVTVPGLELSRGGGGLRCMTLPIERQASV